LESACVEVPNRFAVEGMNWIKPIAPDPAKFFLSGLNDLPDSNAMQAIK
jgi:hypothetical protein